MEWLFLNDLFVFNKRWFDWSSYLKKDKNWIKIVNILFPTELHLKNVYYLYSACSNPTNVVLLIVLSMIIGKGAWYWDR